VILTAVADTPLNLYKLTAEGTERKRLLWQHIEKRTSEWWINEYGFAGHSTQIIKGIIKFCSYSDPKRKQIVARWLAANDLEQSDLELVGLTNWNEDFSKEEFSLEAISVFSKLSLLDEPLIIVFDQLEGLGLPHNQTLLFNFGEAVKEIFTHVPNSLIILNLFPDRWQQFQQVLNSSVVERVAQTQIRLNRPSKQSLQEILQLKAQTIGIDINTFFTPSQRETILSQPSIRAVLNCAADYFRYKVQGIPVPHQSAPQEPISSHADQFAPDSLSLEQRLARLEAGFAALQQVFSQIAHVFNVIDPPETAPQQPRQPSFEPSSQPLLEYLHAQRRFLRQEYSRPQIITDSDDLGKLITIAEACKTLKPFEIDYLQFGKRKLPEHLVLQSTRRIVAVGFLHIDGGAFTSRIKNWNELVISYDRTHFQLWRDVRQAEISGKVGREEIEKLNHSSNGVFLLMEQEQRLDFELLYRLIVDIQNRDLDIELATALESTLTELKDSWICQLLELL
jgi:hypothetical protein